MAKFRNNRPQPAVDRARLVDTLRDLGARSVEAGEAILQLAARLDPEGDKHEFLAGNDEGECSGCGDGADAPQHLDVNGDPIGGF